jgi:ligand-binding sensor domain-containing protein
LALLFIACAITFIDALSENFTFYLNLHIIKSTISFILLLSLSSFLLSQTREWIIYNTSNSGLPSDYVNAIAIDRQGNKWIATSDGWIAKFDGVNWTVYNSGLPSNYVWAIAR